MLCSGPEPEPWNEEPPKTGLFGPVGVWSGLSAVGSVASGTCGSTTGSSSNSSGCVHDAAADSATGCVQDGAGGVACGWVITLWWKISVHAAIAAGTATVLLLVFGLALLVVWPLVALIAWSRVQVGDHTPAPVVEQEGDTSADSSDEDVGRARKPESLPVGGDVRVGTRCGEQRR